MSQKRNNYDYDNNDEQSSSSSKKNRRINKNGILGYTNEDNPFGDDELNRPFKWLKKDDDDEYTYSKDEITNKILNNEEKILEVRKRRQKFEKEKRDREEARENMKRLEELEKMEDLYAQQEAFEKKQAFANCRVRLTKNNAKPIDYLIKNILLIPEMNFPLSDFDNTQLSTTLSPELRSPHDLLYSLSEEEKSEIISDIELLKEYEPLKPYHEYFDTLVKYINMLIANKNESSFNEKTLSEIDEIYMDKEYDELLELSNSIKDELDHGENTDVDYWSTVYMRLSEYMYNQLLVKMNKEFISKRDPALVAQSLENEQLNSANQMNAPLKQYPIISIEEGVDDLYSPPPLTSSLSSSYPVMTLDEFKQDLEKQRKETKEQELDHLITSLLLSKKTVVKFESIGDYDEDTLYRYEESKGMDTDETQMKDEVSLPKTTYKWEDKYKPRKPKYFNRVKSGFDWNQYNQTHYDSENPPPKMIQGYRFNIFYPDLIRKDITPRYFLEPLEDQHYCIIRFHAGPPYEDIAFKIVNRQWDKVPRHGFKHFFERGILHLHFDFKRYRYRR